MEKIKILVADPISPKGIEYLKKNPAFDVETRVGLSEGELAAIIPSYHAILIRSETKIRSSLIQVAEQLRVIGRAGVGIDNVDVPAATARGIVVMNTPVGNTISTAEHAFSLLMSLARNIPQAHLSMTKGEWDRKSFQGVELKDKTLGIIGVGRIGSEVAKRAQVFGMRVIAYDPFLTHARAQILQIELFETLEEMLPQADFITLHVPGTPETMNLLDAKRLACCKKGARLINCARGGLINEEALLQAIDSGHIAAAALDVFTIEPLPQNSPLRSHPKIILTPHLGASTQEAQENVGLEIAEAVEAYLLHGIIRNAVNMPNVEARALAVLKPYIQAATRLGYLVEQLTPHRLDAVKIHYSGKVNEHDTTPITRAALKGLLLTAGGTSVNEVNVLHLADNLGLKWSEHKNNDDEEYKDLITLEAIFGKEHLSVAVAIFGNRPRIVRVNDRNLEAALDGKLLVIENRDRPGIIGWLGTILGRHHINIASMALGRAEPGSRALSILHLDSVPSTDALQEIAQDKDIYSVKFIDLR
ncbi:MAG: phosphoglycerate dehydrogenase [Verrucomicrobiae bacterium]|nr:phosphoglycerate dehydrogenase [Verrucomicrobiae bacterium]